MKKIFSFFAAAFIAAGVVSAQDINKAIELANNGNEAFQLGEYQLAVDAFTQSLAIAEGLGEAGAEHANTCKTALGAIYLANSKNLIKASDFAGALSKLDETIAVAEKYNLTDIAENAKSLIPNVVSLRLYSSLLDSAVAEHAARMVAMQVATDNADDLISELTLEYNKCRQQAITNELLDIVSGS